MSPSATLSTASAPVTATMRTNGKAADEAAVAQRARPERGETTARARRWATVDSRPTSVR